MVERDTTKESVFGRMSTNLLVSLRTASLVSDYFQEKRISLSSIVVGLVLNENCLARRTLDSMGISPSDVMEVLYSKKNIEVVGDTSVPRKLLFSKEAADAIQRGFALAQRMAHVYFGTEHLMVAVLESKSRKIQKLKTIGLTSESFRNSLGKKATY
ncbi:MAG TPA: Clp protease N-terminal domain-containing protein, partial [Candidatus Dojkabacteria bacterium]|nr:Clp protease N-terminal domain-containing protein [Candidatus Dojkabacteria bacterium]